VATPAATRRGGGRTARGGDGRFLRTLETTERDAKACRLAAQGWTLDAIAAELGYAAKGNVSRAIHALLIETANAAGAGELRLKQLREMAELRRSMWAVVDDPPPLVDRQGRIVIDGATGERIPDIQAQVGAAAVIIRAAEREAKLTGADAPRRTEVLSLDLIQAEILRLRTEHPDLAATVDRERGQLVAGEVDTEPEPSAAAAR
jgi:hypothetical protein